MRPDMGFQRVSQTRPGRQSQASRCACSARRHLRGGLLDGHQERPTVPKQAKAMLRSLQAYQKKSKLLYIPGSSARRHRVEAPTSHARAPYRYEKRQPLCTFGEKHPRQPKGKKHKEARVRAALLRARLPWLRLDPRQVPSMQHLRLLEVQHHKTYCFF